MNDFEAKLEKLTTDVAQLKKKGKDHWDKFQILAALLVPASIAVVGFLVSTSLKDAEIVSAAKVAAGQEAIARINARVAQANLVKSFMDTLFSEEVRKRKLAIEAMLIALPEDGPRLVKIVSETDPDEDVRLFAKTQQRIESLLNAVGQISDKSALELIKSPPVRDSQLENIVALRDPSNLRQKDPKIARDLLKMMAVYADRDIETVEVWEAAIVGIK